MVTYYRAENEPSLKKNYQHLLTSMYSGPVLKKSKNGEGKKPK